MAELSSAEIQQIIVSDYLRPLATIVYPDWDEAQERQFFISDIPGGPEAEAAAAAAVAAGVVKRDAFVANRNTVITDAQAASDVALDRVFAGMAGAAPPAAVANAIKEFAKRRVENVIVMGGVARGPATVAAAAAASTAAFREAGAVLAALPAGADDAAKIAAIENIADPAMFIGGSELSQRGGSLAQVRAVVRRALALNGGALAPYWNMINLILAGPLILSKKGFLIYNVPKSDEIYQRLCSVNYIKSKGWSVTRANLPQILVSDAYKTMPSSDFETCKAIINIPQAVKNAFVNWDKRVEQIRDAMSQNPAVRGAAAFAPKNIINPPTYQTLTAFSKYPASVQSALVRVRTPTNTSVTQTMGQLAALRVVQSQLGGQRGGQRGGNPHAPLYPTMVMNGGAHPFATFHGGATMEPAQVLIDKVKSLKDQFRSVTGQALAGPLSAQIDAYATTVNQQLKDIQEKLKVLAGANAALAQYPLGAGVDLKMGESNLKEYAQHAKDLQVMSEKAMKKMDKLSEIKDLLQDLVDKQNPAPIAP